MTAQFSEKLIYKGETLSLFTTPLDLMVKNATFRWKFEGTCTALWRGYVGTWSIEADRLYLKAIKVMSHEIDDDSGWKSLPLDEQFASSGEGVFAHWYTGELRCPLGGLIKYVHCGFESIYEEDLFLKIRRGKLMGERLVRNGGASHRGPRRDK